MQTITKDELTIDVWNILNEQGEGKFANLSNFGNERDL